MCKEKYTCTKMQNKVQERGEAKALERKKGQSMCFHFLGLFFLVSDVISIITFFFLSLHNAHCYTISSASHVHYLYLGQILFENLLLVCTL